MKTEFLQSAFFVAIVDICNAWCPCECGRDHGYSTLNCRKGCYSNPRHKGKYEVMSISTPKRCQSLCWLTCGPNDTNPWSRLKLANEHVFIEWPRTYFNLQIEEFRKSLILKRQKNFIYFLFFRYYNIIQISVVTKKYNKVYSFIHLKYTASACSGSLDYQNVPSWEKVKDTCTVCQIISGPQGDRQPHTPFRPKVQLKMSS